MADDNDTKKVTGNSRARIAITIAAAGMITAGETIKALDEDTTGTDDIAGKLLSVGGKAMQRLARGDQKGFDKNLKLVADSIYEYLEVEPEEEPEE